jgi:hypothetical protein
MVQILQIMLFVSTLLATDQTPKIDLIIYNYVSNRPTPRSVNSFWSHKEHLDTISISGGKIPEYIVQCIKRLNKEGYTYELSIEAALIVKSTTRCDTLYTNHFFQLWQTKEGNFIDSSGQLARMFSGLNLIQNFESDK